MSGGSRSKIQPDKIWGLNTLVFFLDYSSDLRKSYEADQRNKDRDKDVR